MFFLFLLSCKYSCESSHVLGSQDIEVKLFNQEYTTSAPKKILIDPGHGCNDPGAKGVSYIEKEINWDLASTVVNHLNSTRYFKATLTRKSKDSGCHNGSSAWRRGRLADQKKMDLLISLHADGPSTNLEGSWIIWSNQKKARSSSKKSELLANLLGASFLKSGFKTFNMKSHYNEKNIQSNLKYLTTNDRYGAHIDHKEGLGILRNTTKPAVLIETHWLQNPKEAQLFQQSKTQKRYAVAIEKAIVSYFAAESKLYSPYSQEQTYTVQVFASKNKQEVNEFATSLKKHQSLSDQKYSITHFKRGSEDWFRLRIGSFSSIEDAKKLGQNLELIGVSEYWIAQ